jgi:uncharacterized protein (DUF305 family)
MNRYSLVKMLIIAFAVVLMAMQNTYSQHSVKSDSQMSATNAQMPMDQTPKPPPGMMQGGPMMMQNPNLPYEQRALNMMIMHQQMGINMAQNVQQNTQCAELKQLAQKMIDENTSLIKQMQAYRKQAYGQ